MPLHLHEVFLGGTMKAPLRIPRFHTGMRAGEWLVVTRYASWEAYGKAQEGLAKDPAHAKLINITVGVDL